jgi:hypothetical protein
MWQQWINILLGLWIIAVPFTNITGTTLTWTLAITGIAVAALALWSVLEDSSYESRSLQRG